MDLLEVQKILGHHSILTTARYTHLTSTTQSLYTLMIRCAWQTVHSFAHNDKQLQGTPGAIAVLHTHSRRLDYHPHVHLVVPAAAIDAKKRLWRTKKSKGKKRYLFNHKALAKVFRAKRDANGPGGEVPVADPAACLGQRLPPRPQLRLPASHMLPKDIF